VLCVVVLIIIIIIIMVINIDEFAGDVQQ